MCECAPSIKWENVKEKKNRWKLQLIQWIIYIQYSYPVKIFFCICSSVVCVGMRIYGAYRWISHKMFSVCVLTAVILYSTPLCCVVLCCVGVIFIIFTLSFSKDEKKNENSYLCLMLIKIFLWFHPSLVVLSSIIIIAIVVNDIHTCMHSPPPHLHHPHLFKLQLSLLYKSSTFSTYHELCVCVWYETSETVRVIEKWIPMKGTINSMENRWNIEKS